MSEKKTYTFSADIQQLLSLIINTFYSNKEIFLRELLSNSSDALDKVRFNSITDSSILESDKNLEIVISTDNENRLLKIRDSGIGMTHEDLVNNLGTIARSGTKKFKDALNAGADIALIGQFGVGFYSGFLVADKVTVRTKNNNDEQLIWSSTADGDYSIEKDNCNDIKRGTEIILHLKENMSEYLEKNTLTRIIKKHSNFVTFPIKFKEIKIKNDIKEKEDEDEEEEEKENDEIEKNSDNIKVEDVDEKNEKNENNIEYELNTVNNNKPIWRSDQSTLKESDYNNFYKSISNDWDDPLAYKHISVEGASTFKSILFIPKRAPFDLFNSNENAKSNIKLYVNNVLISENADNILPNYLSFIRGIVDSSDVPLNVSREMLQENDVMKVIRKHLIKKSIELIVETMNNEEKLKVFYPIYEKNIKLGIHEDSNNRVKLISLCKYLTCNIINKDEQNPIDLDYYVKNMKEDQKFIYYITGTNFQNIHNSAFLEKNHNMGYDTIYMTDPMDEYCMNIVKEYKGYEFKCMTTNDYGIESEYKLTEDDKEFFNKITDLFKDDGDLEKIVPSPRLILSPAVIVTNKNMWTANMERIAKSQALVDNQKSAYMTSKKIWEFNMEHPIIKKLKFLSKDKDSENNFKDAIAMLYESSLLVSGFTLNNTPYFTSKMFHLLSLGLEINNLNEWEKEKINELKENKNKKEDEKTNEDPKINNEKKVDLKNEEKII